MTSQHNQTDNLVRAYLLGTLEGAAAAEFEQNYFVDKEFLRQVLSAETTLIRDYLTDQLTGFDKQQFERKYLRVPQLRKRVEEVRATLQGSDVKRRAPKRGFFLWLVPAMAAIILLIVAGVVFEQRPGERPRFAKYEQKIVRPVPAIILNLSPGLMKGAEVQNAAPVAPGKDTDLQLNLERPGRTKATESTEYTVHLLQIEADDSRREVWSGRSSKFAESPGGSVLSVEIPGSLVLPGDYLVEIRSAQDVTMETYVFHLKSSH